VQNEERRLQKLGPGHPTEQMPTKETKKELTSEGEKNQERVV
jgi:hypothetical protein